MFLHTPVVTWVVTELAGYVARSHLEWPEQDVRWLQAASACVTAGGSGFGTLDVGGLVLSVPVVAMYVNQIPNLPGPVRRGLNVVMPLVHAALAAQAHPAAGGWSPDGGITA
ncbi:MAG TPA: hypothetical protein VD866_10935 [Urbifossiella sp.]|nr:hypothetical protein [Urbifossiella sp.]